MLGFYLDSVVDWAYSGALAPVDVLLHKLRWRQISPTDRQLTDGRGRFLVPGDELDRGYLYNYLVHG